MAMIDAPEGRIVSNSRLPKELHRQLALAAREACRSLNSEIVVRLRESFQADSANKMESAT